jgi:hypothetical protein
LKRAYKYLRDVIYTRRRKDRLRDVVVEEAFSPSDISGLVLWLDADAIEGLNDGDPVTTWEDQSGQGHDFAQPTASAKPTYQTNELNGKPIVRFDGTDDFLRRTDNDVGAFGTDPFSIFIVIQTTDSTARILLKENEAGGGDGLYIYGDGNDYLYWNGTTGIAIGASDSSFHLIAVTRSGTGAGGLVPYYDAAAQTAGTESRTLSGTTTLYIGTTNDDPVYLAGDIAEIIIYDSALSQANRESVEDYISNKYGIF